MKPLGSPFVKLRCHANSVFSGLRIWSGDNAKHLNGLWNGVEMRVVGISAALSEIEEL